MSTADKALLAFFVFLLVVMVPVFCGATVWGWLHKSTGPSRPIEVWPTDWPDDLEDDLQQAGPSQADGAPV